MEISIGTPADFADIVDFGNYVFSSVDFPNTLPKLYCNPEMAKYHYLIKEDTRIKAAVGSYDLSLNVMGDRLKLKGIGMVSVHRYSRDKGYMKALMGRAVSDIEKENGFDVINVYFERANGTGFDFAEGKLPNNMFYKTGGFSDGELMELKDYLLKNSFLIWEIASEHGRNKIA